MKARIVTTLLLLTIPVVPFDNNLFSHSIFYSSGCGGCEGAGLPPKPVTTCGTITGAGANEACGADGTGVEFDNATGVGGLSHPEFAAFSAAACESLSPPANIMPDRVPVKNVAIGTISSKNFWSIGEIAFNGCVTKINEYKTTNTIPNTVNDRQMPIKNFRRAINCSSV